MIYDFHSIHASFSQPSQLDSALAFNPSLEPTNQQASSQEATLASTSWPDGTYTSVLHDDSLLFDGSHPHELASKHNSSNISPATARKGVFFFTKDSVRGSMSIKGDSDSVLNLSIF
jgi:hypothetical protein